MELRRIRFWMTLFIVGLVLSGVTALPLQLELDLLARLLGIPDGADPAQLNTLQQWIAQVRRGIHETNANFPFLAYGTDWLAFAHLIIAALFVGPLARSSAECLGHGADLQTRPARFLRNVFCTAAERFLSDSDQWRTRDSDEWGGISGVATAVLLGKDEALCAWVGKERACVLHQEECLFCIAAESMENRILAAEGTKPRCEYSDRREPGRRVAAFCLRTIAQDGDWEPQLVRWPLPRDWKIVVGSSQFPTPIPLVDMLPLLDMDPKKRNEWCNRMNIPYACIATCTP